MEQIVGWEMRAAVDDILGIELEAPEPMMVQMILSWALRMGNTTVGGLQCCWRIDAIAMGPQIERVAAWQ